MFRPTPTLLALSLLAPVVSGADGDPVPSITVTAARDGSRIPDASGSATRTATPLDEIPQSIQVLDRGLIDDQQSLTLTEVLANASGVRSQPLLNRNLDPGSERKIRGFQAEVYRGGFPLHYNAGDRESLANVERVEVLKGPTALLYANGVGAPTGGLINLVLKQPESTRFASARATAGSYGLLAGAIDVNQPLASGEAGSIQARVTADVGRQKSHIDVIEGEHGSIDPTIALRNAHGTTVTVHGRWSQVLQQDYAGLPIQGTIRGAPYAIDPDLFPASPDLPRTRSQVASIDATLEQRLGEHATLTIPVQYARSTFRQYGQYLVTSVSTFAPVYMLDSAYVAQDIREFSITPTVAWTAATGTVRTTLLAGCDYDRTTERGAMIGGTAFPPYDVTNPVPPPFVLDPANATYIDADNVYRTYGAFAQIQATFADRFTVVGGLRYAYVRICDRDLVSGDQTYSESRLLPRIGVIARIADPISVFADYGQGFRAFPYSQFTADPKPEESDQLEAGIKVEAERIVSATASVFQLTRTNVNTADPHGGFLQVQTGEQRSRGVELDLQIAPDEHWTVAANVALTDAEVTKDTTYEGNALMGVPRHAGRVWLGYEFSGSLSGLGLGAGLTAVGKQQVDIANTAKTPAYAIVDAGAHYAWRGHTASLGAKNLFDKRYYEPDSYIGGPRVTPGEPLTIVASIETRF